MNFRVRKNSFEAKQLLLSLGNDEQQKQPSSPTSPQLKQKTMPDIFILSQYPSPTNRSIRQRTKIYDFSSKAKLSQKLMIQTPRNWAFLNQSTKLDVKRMIDIPKVSLEVQNSRLACLSTRRNVKNKLNLCFYDRLKNAIKDCSSHKKNIQGVKSARIGTGNGICSLSK